ncbi:WD1261 family protein [Wolbachia endosymbiont (group A) of Anomoia purmunda]|uniref:WD1261 family protein n=1 Tax=Wolbachia endosymbiont (group A) of Anomoia purmunda TaxID=2953978 RepID=UPI002232CB47|nr:hypothetical protein [Wolbachia endosymbiont (group A) of Anomoia purmunda]
MVKEVEELIKIVGKGNLLETLFIFLGGFQHADLDRFMDHRNHIGLSAFIQKQDEQLDYYFNLKFSLQGLFLIYALAYRILSENNNLNTKDIIDEIYKVIKESKLGKDINEVVDGKKLDLLNILANPKREPIFKTEEDFENKVLTDVKKLLNEKSDRKFSFNKFVIGCYYSIHQDIKVDKDVALLFSLLSSFSGSYKEPLSSDKIVKREVLELDKSQLIALLAKMLTCIDLSSENRSTKYTLNLEKIGSLNRTFNTLADQNNQDFPTFKSIGSTLKQLLKNQSSDEFEQLVTSPDNIYYSVPQEENECRPNLIISKKKEKDHKNIICKLILGIFVLSIGLYVADYFLMEQKLFNSIKNVLPQDNLTNLIVATVLTIVIVYALFQLLKSPQEPPLSTVNETTNENLEPLRTK